MGKRLNNEEGFTLIEIMIGCGLLGMLALAFAEMMTYQAKQQAAVAQKAAFMQIAASVSASAQDTNAALKSANYQVAGTAADMEATEDTAVSSGGLSTF